MVILNSSVQTQYNEIWILPPSFSTFIELTTSLKRCYIFLNDLGKHEFTQIKTIYWRIILYFLRLILYT